MAIEQENSVITDVLYLDDVALEITHPTGLARYGAGIAVPATCDIVAIIDNPDSDQAFTSQAA